MPSICLKFQVNLADMFSHLYLLRQVIVSRGINFVAIGERNKKFTQKLLPITSKTSAEILVENTARYAPITFAWARWSFV